MPPKKDICVALKKFLIICKDSQRTWQTIFTIINYCVQHFTTCIYMNMQITGVFINYYHVYIYYVQIYTRICCVLTQFDGVVDQEPMCKVVYSCII